MRVRVHAADGYYCLLYTQAGLRTCLLTEGCRQGCRQGCRGMIKIASKTNKILLKADPGADPGKKSTGAGDYSV